MYNTLHDASQQLLGHAVANELENRVQYNIRSVAKYNHRFSNENLSLAIVECTRVQSLIYSGLIRESSSILLGCNREYILATL